MKQNSEHMLQTRRSHFVDQNFLTVIFLLYRYKILTKSMKKIVCFVKK